MQYGRLTVHYSDLKDGGFSIKSLTLVATDDTEAASQEGAKAEVAPQNAGGWAV
jgi:hypothetical protein